MENDAANTQRNAERFNYEDELSRTDLEPTSLFAMREKMREHLRTADAEVSRLRTQLAERDGLLREVLDAVLAEKWHERANVYKALLARIRKVLEGKG